MSSYIELHTASAFSFLQGASLPEAIVDRAADLGYPALALLDRDGVYGAPRFHKAALAAGIKPIIGAELTVASHEVGRSGRSGKASRSGGAGGSGESSRSGREDGLTHPAYQANQAYPSHPAYPLPLATWALPVLCASQEGYRNLCRLITRMKMRAPKGKGALAIDEIDGSTRGLVALVGCAALDGQRHGVGGLLDRVVGMFGRDSTYVEIQRHFRRDEEADNERLIGLAAAFGVPTLVTGGVRFATPAGRPLFDVLTCLHHHTDLARAGRRLAPNAERYLKPPADMAALFADLPGAIGRTAGLADRLQFTMADLGYRFPAYPVPPGETEASFLRKIADVGARERYRPYHDRARAQILRELDLIEKLSLAGYFLIVWDIINFCRQHDILVQGRGSAANSAVCYSLGITAVDPVGMDLLFERFLSEERGEWPDIDLDLPSGDRRERVIQHVYEKYGRLGAAMTANVITYRGRSAAREVGTALGFEPQQIDRLAKVMNNFEFTDPADTLPRHLASVGLDLNSDRVRLFARLWGEMQDLPRHLGQHSGGMVICQGQLDAVVPLENASMPGRVVVQWDKDDCADMGIVKVDLLGLGMMAVIQDALALVNGETPIRTITAEHAENALRNTAEHAEHAEHTLRNTAGHAGHAENASGKIFSADSACSAVTRPLVDLAHLPPDDPAVYRMLCEADTIGVFQVESRAQMATLPRLKPKAFYDLVVQVAIIRPGPIVGQMVHPYLNRRAGREPVRYAHPSLEPILARTLGVPLFQEQLLRIAMVAAGFTGGQAEELRRAMGFKRSERRMKQIEVQLRDGMAARGIAGEAAEQIVASIASFALYGFPESHAASFALLAYASAYLKVHYPAAFYTALLNNQPMGFYHPSTLVKDAQRRGVRFHPIDVQRSDWECTVEPDGAIRLGLRYVSGLREQAGRAIASARPAPPVGLAPPARPALPVPPAPVCPKCGCDDESMLEPTDAGGLFCNVCAHHSRLLTSGASARQAHSSGANTGLPGRSTAGAKAGGFTSMDDLVARAGVRRDELVTLADIGALNAFGYDRRSALWQAERAVRPAGELFENSQFTIYNLQGEGDDSLCKLSVVNCKLPEADPCPLKPMTEAERAVRPAGELFENSQFTIYNLQSEGDDSLCKLSVVNCKLPEADPCPLKPMTEAERAVRPAGELFENSQFTIYNLQSEGDDSLCKLSVVNCKLPEADPCSLKPMTEAERLVADYAGTGLTIGRHPMALGREELAMRGVLRASDLHSARPGRRVRVAGMVITRQRPGTAKGFVFLTLEDETGIANIIVRPDLFARDRLVVVEEPFLIVDGVLQNQDGVTSVRAEQVQGLRGLDVSFDAHDFY